MSVVLRTQNRGKYGKTEEKRKERERENRLRMGMGNQSISIIAALQRTVFSVVQFRNGMLNSDRCF
jgi:hypothetical protein